MADPARQIRALAATAAEAQRSLEARVERADRGWSDDARRSFEAEHLAAIRADAHHLRAELDELARLAGIVTRELRSER